MNPFPHITRYMRSLAASTLAKAGAEKRRESFAAKQARVHAELRAFVEASRLEAGR